MYGSCPRTLTLITRPRTLSWQDDRDSRVRVSSASLEMFKGLLRMRFRRNGPQIVPPPGLKAPLKRLPLIVTWFLAWTNLFVKAATWVYDKTVAALPGVSRRLSSAWMVCMCVCMYVCVCVCVYVHDTARMVCVYVCVHMCVT
jgi:hypothetical protein